MADEVLEASEFYTRTAQYVEQIDPGRHERDWRAGIVEERQILQAAVGEGHGRAALDCTCGTGLQAVPLAQLGWQVTGTDITAAYLDRARVNAAVENVAVDFSVCDVRSLAERFADAFDLVVSCMALDNLIGEGEIPRALRGMLAALKPGGRCYIRVRDFDNIMRSRPRYDVKDERPVPHGRLIRLEDFDYDGDPYVVNTYVYLYEDSRKSGYAWESRVFSYRRRALRKAELDRYLRDVGFESIRFLPQPSPWRPYEVVATKPTSPATSPTAQRAH